MTITFPDWVTVSKCETRSHSTVFPRNFFDVHGATKRITTFENHDVETDWVESAGQTFAYYINPYFPLRLHLTVGSETKYFFDDTIKEDY